MVERRGSGLLRVPFVRMCSVEFDGGAKTSAFIVNINVLGAYLAWDEIPGVGQGVALRFTTPGNALELGARALVAWVNPKQQHKVHSLPPGFGIKFTDLPAQTQERIETVVRDYLARHPQHR